MNCTFCNEIFTPRPQVKSPKACSNPKCQRARQKSNEIAWKERNRPNHDATYHRIRRGLRVKKLREMISLLVAAMCVGGRLNNFAFNVLAMTEFLVRVVTELGSRRANKLWNT